MAGGNGGSGGSGGSGGGIINSGTLTVKNSTISGNSTGAGANGTRGGDGGTNANGGTAGVSGAGGSGGGIENAGSLTIFGSTIVGNRTGAGGNGGTGGNGNGTGRGGNGSAGSNGGSGGGIDSSFTMSVTNTTITGNTTAAGGSVGSGGSGGGGAGGIGGPGQPGNGGGINQSAMGATLTHVTVASNTAAGNGGGVSGNGGSISTANSVVAANSAAVPTLNCAGVVPNQGNNIEFGATSCSGFFRADPKLGSLANNGGPTQTIALAPGSPAIHHVPTCVLSTDQRGVSRPLGSACDSGAYEFAPPSVSGVSGVGSTTRTATIIAQLNPNLKDTTVAVEYGTTPAYGSTTGRRDVGAGNSATSFIAGLTGLSPNTTYHFAVVASNGDGTTTSGDQTLTTLATTGASIGASSSSGPMLSLTLICRGGTPGTKCSGPITVTAHVATQGKSVVAVTASRTTKEPRPKPNGKRTKNQIVSRGRYSVATGHSTTVRLKLNGAGQKLLAQFYTLPATVHLGGRSGATKSVTFSYGRLHISPAFTWAFGPTFSFATELTLTGLPKKSRVTLLCNGHGCPFAKRSFNAPKRGKLPLASVLKQSHLSPHTTVELEITAPNDIGEVVIFTVIGGKQPSETFRCLPPGAHRPSACARS